MRGRLKQLWVELTSAASYEQMGLPPTAAWWTAQLTRMQLIAAPLVIAFGLWLGGCSGMGQAIEATRVLTELASAAKDVHEGVRQAQEADEAEARAILRKQLPRALDGVDAALGAVCADPLSEHEEMCSHYRAYKRGKDAVCSTSAAQ